MACMKVHVIVEGAVGLVIGTAGLGNEYLRREGDALLLA